MSIGIHNAALVIAITISEHLLGNPEMAIPRAAYDLFAYIVCGVFVWDFQSARGGVRFPVSAPP